MELTNELNIGVFAIQSFEIHVEIICKMNIKNIFATIASD